MEQKHEIFSDKNDFFCTNDGVLVYILFILLFLATHKSSHEMTETSFINKDPRESVAINPEEFSVKPILILDLNFELLHSQVAYLPGSRDKRGGPVIFFETDKSFWENADMNSEELAKLLVYYFKIVRYFSSQNIPYMKNQTLKFRQ